MSLAPLPTRPALDLDAIVGHCARFLTTEYASLTAAGAPVTWPVTPHPGVDGRTLDVATGITYPLKAERARRNRKVALSFSFPLGSGLDDPATVLVQGLATVRDRDLVATSGRYLQASADRFPHSFARIPAFQLRRMDWYWTRAWIEVTPVTVRWWPGGRLTEAPLVWRAPADVDAPPSDPPPSGTGAGSWRPAPTSDWRVRAAGAPERLGPPVVTTVDDDGWPAPWRAVAVEATAEGYRVQVPAGVDVRPGPAFVTFHEHGEVFDGQENIGLAGRIVAVDGTTAQVAVDRALADFGISRNPLRSAVAMLRVGRALRPRLARECARRDVRPPRFEDLGFTK
jgi:hypothetical protein